MEKGKRKVMRILYWVLLVSLMAVFLFAAFMIFRHFHDEKKSAQQFDALVEIKQQVVQQITEEVETPPTAAEVYAPILEKNSDFIGWIKIEGTRIDYPVVQTPHDSEYYLRRGFDKKYSYYGVPFAAGNCEIDNCDNTIIYGHNMTNGTMFSDLGKYWNKKFWQEHRYIQFDTMGGFGTYEIIAVLKTAAGSKNEFKYFQFADGDAEAFANYVKECKARSLYDTGVTAVEGDQLITLSTCEYSRENGRMAIIAKRIK